MDSVIVAMVHRSFDLWPRVPSPAAHSKVIASRRDTMNLNGPQALAPGVEPHRPSLLQLWHPPAAEIVAGRWCRAILGGPRVPRSITSRAVEAAGRCAGRDRDGTPASDSAYHGDVDDRDRRNRTRSEGVPVRRHPSNPPRPWLFHVFFCN